MLEHFPIAAPSVDAFGHDSLAEGTVSTIANTEPADMHVAEFLTRLSMQVNALAVRAEVDAGRMGQLGRSMEAVAGEMRSMARRAADAAKSLNARLTSPPEVSVAAEGMANLMQFNVASAEITEREIELFVRHLPKSALAIAEVIGMKLTVILLQQCRGCSFVVHGKDHLFLANIIGIEAADKLREWMGVNPLHVPICKAAERAFVGYRIRSEFDFMTRVEKMSARMAVRSLTHFASPPMHERSIWRILKRSDEPEQNTQKKDRATSETGVRVGLQYGRKLK